MYKPQKKLPLNSSSWIKNHSPTLARTAANSRILVTSCYPNARRRFWMIRRRSTSNGAKDHQNSRQSPKNHFASSERYGFSKTIAQTSHLASQLIQAGKPSRTLLGPRAIRELLVAVCIMAWNRILELGLSKNWIHMEKQLVSIKLKWVGRVQSRRSSELGAKMYSRLLTILSTISQ